MLKNYFKVAWRSLFRNKVATFINIFGLSAGICSCLFIFLYVNNELSYDAHHTKANRIFRITSDVTMGGNFDKLSRSSFSLGPMLVEEYPEVERAVRVLKAGKQTFWKDDQVYQQEQFFYTDVDFFEIFDYDFIEGDPKSALADVHTIVISDEIAKQVFGKTNGLIGEHLKFAKNHYKITGVFRYRPNVSHLDIKAFLPIKNLPHDLLEKLKSDWFYMSQSNYVLFREVKDHIGFEKKLEDFSERHIKPWLELHDVKGNLIYHLQPLREIHLTNHFKYDDAEVTNKSYIYIFSAVALFILLIACINYMNLATAKASKRARETGIRKANGASRKQLIFQFLSESLLISIFAILLALALVELLIPVFNELSGKSLSLSFYKDLHFLAFLGCLLLLTGLISGFYPAFVLSGFKPIQLLKPNASSSSIEKYIRKGLVVVQFAISSALIVCTYIVYSQMHYMKNKDVGFDKEAIMVIKVPIADSSFVNRVAEVRSELEANSAIKLVSGSNGIPGSGTGSLFHYITYQGERNDMWMNYMHVDYDFQNLMGLKLKEGRFFSIEFNTDSSQAFVVNETAINQFGWQDTESLLLENAFGVKGKIIGVVEDFHYTSLHKPIEPLVFLLQNKIPSYLLVKMNKEEMANTIAFVENRWKLFSKKFPMEYFFLDDHFDKQYRAEKKMLTIFTFFSILTIIIACLGLYGLAAYSVENRTKEIGIRKVMGAETSSILILINKEFMPLILIALIIALPAAWFSMEHWLLDFAFRIPIVPWPFLGATILAICIAIGTISLQALKAAWSNPVDALKYE
ncbi:MAG: ABC transporter permease [Bacteroidia bacterium]